ncbi:MAG: TMEM14 family protein [Microcystaceae cyanobacterium]
MLSSSVIATLIYGILTLVGGIIGYLTARSRPSLISGLISGLLLIGTAILQLQGALWAKWLAVGLTVLLIAVFLFRWRKTKKIMPAGLMVGVGVACLVVMLFL